MLWRKGVFVLGENWDAKIYENFYYIYRKFYQKNGKITKKTMENI